jgi:hypothetical protein
MTDEDYNQAVAAVPAPAGFIWCADPAASGWRLRLFGDGAFRGQVGAVYVSGEWFVDDPKASTAAAHGDEPDLLTGMRRMLKVAAALGWKL